VENNSTFYQPYSGQSAEMPPKSEVGKMEGAAGMGVWLSGTIKR
jgi:hypothetical protein